MLRGGSWNNNPDNCRSANRNRNARDNRNNNVGFRVVCASSCTLLGPPALDKAGQN
ncbi:MAG: SUMF1/EgtB/PvdO family nonheme iron enzyme [Leptolyngbya sp. SIO4C1]|nr:SUMF1/EgtB/PvdO family nonheme iron enzyme [Leptolyngbya sp. SIO4C1]